MVSHSVPICVIRDATQCLHACILKPLAIYKTLQMKENKD